jgi:hypothetical protein
MGQRRRRRFTRQRQQLADLFGAEGLGRTRTLRIRQNRLDLPA